jgi:thiol-disulfide isomerase/thioredoxin
MTELDFSGATAWLNSSPLTGKQLLGRVVLVNFWTYTCINWLRTAPYLRAWHQKYATAGLVIVGVHTPEFEFEHNLDNVREQVKAMHIDYPVAVDNNYAVWQSFANHFWPASYFADTEGRIRHHQFGEGNYDESESTIQQLLAKAGKTGFGGELAVVKPAGLEVAADWPHVRSAENYLGHQRTNNFDPTTLPAQLELNHWNLSGDWMLGSNASVLTPAPGSIHYRFHARDFNLVAGPARRGRQVPFELLLDGRPPGPAHGSDSDPGGRGAVTGQRTYQLIRQPGPIADRTLEIKFLEPGVELLAATFG